MKFRLDIILDGKMLNRIYLQKTDTIIGRGSNADIKVVTENIGRQHLKISIIKKQLYLTDLGSVNGTKVGDTPLTPNERTIYDTYFLPIKLGETVSITVTEEQ
ncbi:MAG: FHA domain-containing protein [Oligoflexia bacterium]|nr:FHA domain-containing protein [Oligoflexia bacterium]